ncbi:MAG: furin, partial [Dolichospermum sp.]
DLVNASISYTLTNNVENLTLTGAAAINGTGNTANNVITGNSANNTLNGGLGNDTLNGGAGADILTGGVGSDIFVFRFGQSPVSAADRITDFAIGTD